MGDIDEEGMPSNKGDRSSPSGVEPGWEKALFLSVDGFADACASEYRCGYE